VTGHDGALAIRTALTEAQAEETEYLRVNHPELFEQMREDMAEVHYRMGVRSIGAWLEEDDGLLAYYLSPQMAGSDPVFRTGLLETYPHLAIRQIGSQAYADEMRRLQLAATAQIPAATSESETDQLRAEEAREAAMLAASEHITESGGIAVEQDGRTMVVGRITHHIPRDAMRIGPGSEEWEAWRTYASERPALQQYANNPAAYVADVNDFWSIAGRPTAYANGGTNGSAEQRLEVLRIAYPNAFREIRENLSIKQMKKLLTEELSKVFENFSS